MTQGELYKKIDTLRSLKTTNITKKDTANTGPLNFSKKRFRRAIHPIAHIEIEKILDEAKKELPKLQPILVYPQSPIPTTSDIVTDTLNAYLRRERCFAEEQRQAEANIIKYVKETEVWRKKWFGSAQP